MTQTRCSFRAPSPGLPRRKEKVKGNMPRRSHSSRITDADILVNSSRAQTALKSRMVNCIPFFSPLYPCSFFLWVEATRSVCLRDTHTHTQMEDSQFKQEGEVGGQAVGYVESLPSLLSTELCLKFVVFSGKAAVKLDSFRRTLPHLKCDGIKDSCLAVTWQHGL